MPKVLQEAQDAQVHDQNATGQHDAKLDLSDARKSTTTILGERHCMCAQTLAKQGDANYQDALSTMAANSNVPILTTTFHKASPASGGNKLL